jgi:hypothetical protein
MTDLDTPGSDFDSFFESFVEADFILPVDQSQTITNSCGFDDLLKCFDANDIQSQFESSSSNIIDEYQILDGNAIKTTSIRKSPLVCGFRGCKVQVRDCDIIAKHREQQHSQGHPLNLSISAPLVTQSSLTNRPWSDTVECVVAGKHIIARIV